MQITYNPITLLSYRALVVVVSVEVRKLKRELDAAHEKIGTLTSQLNTNVSQSLFHLVFYRATLC